MNLLAKTITAGGLTLLANAAVAEEAPVPLTIDKVVTDLALPLDREAFYFDRALNVAIKEKCDVDPGDANIVHCLVDQRSSLGLLTLQHYDSYWVHDGTLEIVSTPVDGREWNSYDQRDWEKFSTSATTSDLTGTTLGQILLDQGLQTTAEGKIPQNDIFAVTQGDAAVTLGSLLPVGENRAFDLSLAFDAATQRVTATSLTKAALDNGLLTGQKQNANRMFSDSDEHFYDEYKSMDTGFGLRQ